MKKSVFERRIRDLIASLAKYGPVYLVFHDNTQDIKWVAIDTNLNECI